MTMIWRIKQIKPQEICIILEIMRKPNPFFFELTQPCVRTQKYFQSSPLSTPERSDGWKYVCVRSQTQPRLRDNSIFVPFSSNILDFWRHFTADRKRLLNLANASWLWRISWGPTSFPGFSGENPGNEVGWGLEAIRNGKKILNEW